ncbi:formylmethanofuran dehydrogenase subunit C [Tundrisphaera sp. TA3]|uniref:formylmethanofuran dehydrogenase subunit C n=1 Tax=Tundrisphaera sp. TA3 TaxID=3435775 RepID=UPI003EB6ED8B
MALRFTWKNAGGPPIDADAIRPEAFAGLDAAGAARVEVGAGNRMAPLGDLARVEGDGADGVLIFEGDLRRVAGLGTGMASGRIEVRGDVGPRLGAGMTGGEIEVTGSAGIWAGAEMAGGSIRIRGDAGDCLGAALPGSRLGMRDGVILVDGDAGEDVGLAMRRGLIAVGGRTGPGLGRSMIAGSIFAFGPIGRAAGAGMKRGTLALFGGDDPDGGLLPTFAPSGTFCPHTLSIYLRQLAAWGFAVPETASSAGVRRYNGDLVEGGQGEILVVGLETP